MLVGVVDTSAAIAAVRGLRVPHDDKYGLTSFAGGDLGVLQFLCDEVEPPCPLSGNVFHAAATATRKVSVAILDFLIAKGCPVGTPDQQGSALGNIARYGTTTTIQKLRAAGCEYDWRTVGGCLNAFMPESTSVPIAFNGEGGVSIDSSFSVSEAKLRTVLDDGCPHGTDAQQIALIKIAARYNPGRQDVLDLLRRNSFSANSSAFVTACESGASNAGLRWLLSAKKVPLPIDGEGLAAAIDELPWVDVPAAVMRTLPPKMAAFYSFRYSEFCGRMAILQ